MAGSGIEQLFLALMVTWKYCPDPSQIDSYRKIVNKHYDRKLADLFETIVSVQKASLLTWDRKYRFPFNLVRRGERIILYGAGPAGQEAARQAALSDWVTCAGCIDFRYDKFSDLHVQSPDMIRTVSDIILVVMSRLNYIAQPVRKTRIDSLRTRRPESLWS